MSEYGKFESSDHAPTEQDNREIHRYYEGWSCMGPIGAGRRSVNGFWGVILIAVGGTWLASNLFDFDDWGRWAGSILVLALGIWYISGASRRSSRKTQIPPQRYRSALRIAASGCNTQASHACLKRSGHRTEACLTGVAPTQTSFGLPQRRLQRPAYWAL